VNSKCIDTGARRTGGEVQLDGIADLGQRVNVADGATIVGHAVGHGAGVADQAGVAADGGLGANTDLEHAAELELRKRG
jgi:hypothetical protein